ncbi:MAG: RNA helicase, partial [Pseudomonadota bacterium]
RRGRSRGERGAGRRGRRDRQTAPERSAQKATNAETPKPKPGRQKREYKRKDDDPVLEPAPDEVKGFGEEVPAFLKT